MPKGVANKRYTPEFKKLVIETMQEEKLSYSETCRRFEVNSRDRIKSWERIYLEEGLEGFAVERRGRGSTGRPKKLPKDVEEDLHLLLSIAQLPRTTFYYHLKRMNSADKYKAVKAEITAIYHENKGRYGYRRITTELHKRNFLLNHKTVQRLMKELGLVCRVRMKKYRSYKGRSRQNRTKLTESGFPCRKAESEVGHRCDRVQTVRRKALSVPDSRSAQQRYSTSGCFGKRVSGRA